MSDKTPSPIGAAVRPKSSVTARVEHKDEASKRAKRASLGSLESRHGDIGTPRANRVAEPAPRRRKRKA